MMKIISGLDEIQARYSEEFVVETGHNLADGKPAAFKIQNLKPIGMMAAGISWPMMSNGADGDAIQCPHCKEMFPDPQPRNKKRDPEEEQQFWSAVRQVAARSVVAAREVGQEDDGTLVTVWTPVEVVCTRKPNPKAKIREISIDTLDFGDTVARIWGEILKRANFGDMVPDAEIDEENFRNDGADGKAVREVAT